MSAEKTNAEKLGITEGSLIWQVGDSIEELALIDPMPEGVETYDDKVDNSGEDWVDNTWTEPDFDFEESEPSRPSEIDTALIAVSNVEEFQTRLDDTLPRMGSVRRVWVLFPAVELPQEILQAGANEYGWGTLEPVALDETWSAVELVQP
ncbi:MAG TPA: hypothetical protein PLQ19_04230 [Aeromicrobium sp.]|nr:hypothetical protein [Aeromicrobium sp.]